MYGMKSGKIKDAGKPACKSHKYHRFSLYFPLSVVLVCLGIVFSPNLAYADTNILPNSSFEKGDDNWYLEVEYPAEADWEMTNSGERHGDWCCHVTNSGLGAATIYSSSVPVSPNTPYTLSAYARTNGATDVKLALWTLDANGDTISYEEGGPIPIPGDQPSWARFQLNHVTSGNCAFVKVSLISNGGEIWWDSVMLENSFVMHSYRFSLSDNNLLANPSFEEGAGGWTLLKRDPSISGTVETPGCNGLYAYHVVNPTQEIGNVFSGSVPAKAGSTYMLSVSVKAIGAIDTRVSIWALDSSGNTLSAEVAHTNIPTNVPDFTRYTVTAQAPPGTAFLRAYLISHGGEVWWDDVVLEERQYSNNLLTNPGFEDGAEGWVLMQRDPSISGAVETPGFNGLYAYHIVNPTQEIANLYSGSVPAEAGTTYTLSVSAKAVGAYQTRVSIWALDSSNNTLSAEVAHTNIPSDVPDFTRYTVTAQVPAGTAFLRAYLINHGGEIWWDDVMLEGSNLVPNSSFKEGCEGWSLYNPEPGISGTLETSSFNGASAYHVANPTSAGANLYSAELIPVEAGNTYTLSVWAKTIGATATRMSIWTADSSGSTLSYEAAHTNIPADVANFTRYTVTFQASPDTAFVKVHLINHGGEVWWSNVQLEEGNAATAYQNGPCIGADGLLDFSPKAPLYTEAIIREARLQDLINQAQRLISYYAGAPNIGDAETALSTGEALVGDVSAGLQAQYLVPDFLNINYVELEQMMSDAETALLSVWTILGVSPVPDIAPWNPVPFPAYMGRQALAQEIVFYPNFSKNIFFEGRGDWSILEPYGFRLVTSLAGADPKTYNSVGFDKVDQVTRLFEEHGYSSTVTIGAGTLSLLYDIYGESVYLHDTNGNWTADKLNIWNSNVMQIVYDVATAIGDYCQNNYPSIVAYELFNESALSVSGLPGGYSNEAKTAWRSWLEQRYGSIGTLNSHWRTAYASFAEINPPANLSAPPEPASSTSPVPIAPLLEFQRFRADSHALFFHDYIKAMRKGDSSELASYHIVNPATEIANIFSNSVPAQAGTSYTLSVSAKAVGAYQTRASIWALDSSGNTLSPELAHVNIPANVSAFSLYSVTVQAPAGTAFLRAYLINHGGEIWWDDVVLEENQSGNNLLPNPGFEEGSTGWSKLPATRDPSITEAVETNELCYHVVNPTQDVANLYSGSVSAQAGTTYTLSVSAKAVGAYQTRASIWALDSSGGTLSYEVAHINIPSDVSNFTRYTVSAQAPAGTAFLRAHLINHGGEVWWDDVVLEENQSGSNLLPNPGFESGSTGWTLCNPDPDAYGIVETPDSSRLIVSQFAAGILGNKNGAVDLLSLAATPEWDALGTHDWPDDNPATYCLYSVSMSRYTQVPQWEDELIWSHWEERGTPEPEMRAALERNLWRQLAWDKRAVSLFYLESEFNQGEGADSWNNSMLNVEAELKIPRYSTGVIPTVERKANAIKNILLSTKIAPQPVVILYPTTAYRAAAPDSRARIEANAIAGELLKNHEMPFLIPEECILDNREDLADFEVLIAPWATVVPVGLEAKILAWVQAGGTLICSGPFGLHDDMGNPSNSLLTTVFGTQSWSWDAANEFWVLAGADQESYISQTYGAGKVYLFPQPLGKYRRWTALHTIISSVVTVPPVSTSLENIELIKRRDDNGNEYLFAINLLTDDIQLGDVVLQGQYTTVRDLFVDGSPVVPTQYSNGLTTLPVQLAPGEGVLYSLGQPEP